MEGVAWVLGMGEWARVGCSAWFGKSHFLQFAWYTVYGMIKYICAFSGFLNP